MALESAALVMNEQSCYKTSLFQVIDPGSSQPPAYEVGVSPLFCRYEN
jgi:hypothetical protein